jgi:hypothetical protein
MDYSHVVVTVQASPLDGRFTDRRSHLGPDVQASLPLRTSADAKGAPTICQMRQQETCQFCKPMGW